MISRALLRDGLRLQADTLNEERRVAHEEEKDRYQKANGELKQELEDFIMREGKYEKRSCPWAPHYLIDSSVPTPEDVVIQIHQFAPVSRFISERGYFPE